MVRPGSCLRGVDAWGFSIVLYWPMSCALFSSYVARLRSRPSWAAITARHRPRNPSPNPQPTRQRHPCPQNGAEDALDASAVRSRLVVFKVGKDKDASQVVVLGRPDRSTRNP